MGVYGFIRDPKFIISVFLLILTLGVSVRIYLHEYGLKNAERATVKIGVILNHPYIRNGKQVFVVDGVTIKTGLFPKYYFGDYVVVEDRSRSGSILNYPHIQKIEERSNQVLLKVSKFREKVINKVQKALPEPHAALVLGMVLGYKGDFPLSFLETLKRTGTIHIIVVSGYNVSLVLALISVLLIRLGQKAYFVGSVVGIILFVLIVGLDPPVIRAAIMGVITVFAFVNGEYKRSIYILFLTGMLMVLVNPAYIYDISFQMSFVATLAVIIVAGFVHKMNLLITGFAIIIGANLALIPVISYYFERISLLGVLANVLVLWIVPFVTIGGVILMILPTFPIKLFIISMIDFFVVVSESVDKLGFGVFEYSMSIPEIVVYYVILGIGVRFLSKSES